MASSENQATPSAENNAEPIANATITETSSEQSQTVTAAPAADAQPKERLAESSLEASHSELPPLSTISPGNEAASDAAETTVTDARPATRRGLGRGNGGKSGTGSSANPAIGVVEDPTAINESLSGQFVRGYGEQQPRRQRRADGEQHNEPAAQEEPVTNTESNGDGASSENAAPREFVPPVSKGIYKAEMNPERERQAREDKRRERHTGRNSGDNRGHSDRHSRSGDRQEFFGERSEKQKQDWTPTNRPESRDSGQSSSRNPRQKLIIEPAKIPVQAEETFFTKIKRFFGNLFGLSEPEIKKEPGRGGNGRGRNRNDRNGQRGGRGGRYRGDRQGGGNFRHGNRGDSGNPQSFNRDGRHRPHSRGGNHRPNRGE